MLRLLAGGEAGPLVSTRREPLGQVAVLLDSRRLEVAGQS